MRRAVELPDYFVVLPAFRGLYRDISYDYPDLVTDKVSNPYNSANESPMSKPQLLDFLVTHNLLDAVGDEAQDQPATRYWPGDKEERNS